MTSPNIKFSVLIVLVWERLRDTGIVQVRVVKRNLMNSFGERHKKISRPIPVLPYPVFEITAMSRIFNLYTNKSRLYFQVHRRDPFWDLIQCNQNDTPWNPRLRPGLRLPTLMSIHERSMEVKNLRAGASQSGRAVLLLRLKRPISEWNTIQSKDYKISILLCHIFNPFPLLQV